MLTTSIHGEKPGRMVVTKPKIKRSSALADTYIFYLYIYKVVIVPFCSVDFPLNSKTARNPHKTRYMKPKKKGSP